MALVQSLINFTCGVQQQRTHDLPRLQVILVVLILSRFLITFLDGVGIKAISATALLAMHLRLEVASELLLMSTLEQVREIMHGNVWTKCQTVPFKKCVENSKFSPCLVALCAFSLHDCQLNPYLVLPFLQVRISWILPLRALLFIGYGQLYTQTSKPYPWSQSLLLNCSCLLVNFIMQKRTRYLYAQRVKRLSCFGQQEEQQEGYDLSVARGGVVGHAVPWKSKDE